MGRASITCVACGHLEVFDDGLGPGKGIIPLHRWAMTCYVCRPDLNTDAEVIAADDDTV